MANRMVQPMKDLGGSYYDNTWPGYKFKEPLGYTSGRHTGVDYNNGGGGNSDLGYGAYAIAKGHVFRVVKDADSPPGFGNVLIYKITDYDLIKRMGLAGKSVYVRYLHLDEIFVKVGENISIGQRIANVGNTGTNWAHLHADMWHSGNGLGPHLEYHKDSQMASYLDIYTTVQKYLKAPAVVKPAPVVAPTPIQDVKPPVEKEVEIEPKPTAPGPVRPQPENEEEKDPVMEETTEETIKPGRQTSEFWLTLVTSVVIAIAGIIGVVVEPESIEVIFASGSTLIAAITTLYSNGRAQLKKVK